MEDRGVCDRERYRQILYRERERERERERCVCNKVIKKEVRKTVTWRR